MAGTKTGFVLAKPVLPWWFGRRLVLESPVLQSSCEDCPRLSRVCLNCGFVCWTASSSADKTTFRTCAPWYTQDASTSQSTDRAEPLGPCRTWPTACRAISVMWKLTASSRGLPFCIRFRPARPACRERQSPEQTWRSGRRNCSDRKLLQTTKND